MPPKKRHTGQKLLRFDRALGARLVAGADEAGRGPLAGPLVVAAVLLDYECLREHRVRPLALLNDSKQVDSETRDELYRAVLSCAERISVRVFPASVIDRDGLHKCNLRGLRETLWACQPADISLVDGFKLGPLAPAHRAIVDGDTKSAAIAALLQSPSTTARCGGASGPSLNPSTSETSAGWHAQSASRRPRRLHLWRPSRSITAAGNTRTETRSAQESTAR